MARDVFISGCLRRLIATSIPNISRVAKTGLRQTCGLVANIGDVACVRQLERRRMTDSVVPFQMLVRSGRCTY